MTRYYLQRQHASEDQAMIAVGILKLGIQHSSFGQDTGQRALEVCCSTQFHFSRNISRGTTTMDLYIP